MRTEISNTFLISNMGTRMTDYLATSRPELPFRIFHESSKIFVNVMLPGRFIHVNNAILKPY